MKIRFVRNVAVEAIHREAGTVHEIADAVADLLIRDGAAIPAKDAAETASAPLDEAENASIEAKKSAKSKGK